MEKGINIAAQDFRNALIAAINGSHLPACVVHMVLSEIVAQVSEIEKREIEAERGASQAEGGDKSK